MPLSINTNLFALNAQRNLNKTQAPLTTAMQRLSSTLRINSAKDDAAGLAIATRMTTQIIGLQQAVRNTNDGISVIQTAEGAIDEINYALQRMRELAVQSAHGIYTDDDRESMNAEFQALIDEIDRIADQTKFNDTVLLDGTFNVNLQVGYESGNTITLEIANFTATGLGVDELDISDTTGANAALDALLIARDTVASERGNLGALLNRLESTVRNLENIVENLSASRSRIMDADFAVETANFTKALIMQQAGISVLAQANTLPQNVLALLQR